jgi:uncharacterized protein HemX
METPPDVRTEAPPAPRMKAAPEPPAQPSPEPPREAAKKRSPASSRVPSIIVALVVAAVAGLSVWYLMRPQPLLVQGEVDATRFDIAARVDGRVGTIPVERGQDVAAGAVLVRIDNPETIAKHEQALAAKVVAEAQLANINVGTRPEVIAARKAELERAQASVVLAQSANWLSMAMPRSPGSTRRPIPCTKANAPWTRPNPPTIRPSTVIRKRSTRSHRRMSARPSLTSKPCKRSSMRW